MIIYVVYEKETNVFRGMFTFRGSAEKVAKILNGYVKEYRTDVIYSSL